MTPEQITQVIQTNVVLPILFLTTIVIMISVLVIGLLVIDGTQGRYPYKKFMLIWSISLLLAIMFNVLIVSMPNVSQSIMNWVGSLLS